MSLPSEVRHDRMVEELVQSMAQMFGIDYALDIPVGGIFFHGVSGGERKHVSIAEVLAAGPSVPCFDNSTRGLDSSTALDFTKAIHMLMKVGDRTTMATLYQAGETLYNYFDKASCAQRIKFLSYVTDPAHREATPGSVAANMHTTVDFTASFKNSPYYASLVCEIDDYIS
ncbi:hypothetical protein N7463_000488 [Penicillium fimorum]|uniref:Uncharacterized protein n=1 Tax=Penicillium fimorum TaxID=1882269 RepID=A0A9W9Y4C3_9EURO|nr:hypothetical protein N7463_000488 [Penicillium fimorum]